MAKKTNEQFSDLDKVKHYSEIISDNNSTGRQRCWAKMRLSQLTNKISKQTAKAEIEPQAIVLTTAEQHNAFNAGIGYGAAKVGVRVPIKDENKSAFRGGLARGKALKKK